MRDSATPQARQLVNRTSGKVVLVKAGGGDGEQAAQGECGGGARTIRRP
ncbi:hypothetical protein OG389_11610 [Streptomyces sp. NBC_00435]